MRLSELKAGDFVFLRSDTGGVFGSATIVYAGATCFQLSNGLLYSRLEGRCVQCTDGGCIAIADEGTWLPGRHGMDHHLN